MHLRITALPLVASLALAACGGGPPDSGSTSIANGGIVVRGSDVTLHGTNGSEASIDATGSFFTQAGAVPVDEAQRVQLQAYYFAAQAVREHGIATGEAGVASAGAAIKNAVMRIVDVGDQVDRENALAARKVAQAAAQVCMDLRQIKAAQDSLAATLPAFGPYAHILDDEMDCASGR